MLSFKAVPEFRSGIGAAYEFDNGWRLGADIHHISNAGLDRKNPAVEIGGGDAGRSPFRITALTTSKVTVFAGWKQFLGGVRRIPA